jgi:hypothetical protein|tara:strand:+ start:7415 stop:7555 length:141 start_codon:yes stop_codon:yes gene_type:complete
MLSESLASAWRGIAGPTRPIEDKIKEYQDRLDTLLEQQAAGVKYVY